MTRTAHRTVPFLFTLWILSWAAHSTADPLAETAQKWTITEHNNWELVKSGPVELQEAFLHEEGAAPGPAIRTYRTHGEFSIEKHGVLMHLGFGHLRIGKYTLIESASGLIHTSDKKAVAALLVAIDNRTDLHLEIDWNNVCLVIPNMLSCRIVHSGVDVMRKDEMISRTVIEPRSRMARFIFPPHLLYDQQGRWMAKQLFEAVEPGQSIGLFIPFRRGQEDDSVRVVMKRQDGP